jgi:hypothetical protein
LGKGTRRRERRKERLMGIKIIKVHIYILLKGRRKGEGR